MSRISNITSSTTIFSPQLSLINYYIRNGLFGYSLGLCEALLNLNELDPQGQFWKAFTLMQQGIFFC
jgi:hypothetical protein